MKNNTKIRLHLSKQLFESLAKQVLAEAKKGDMSGGAYTEAVKAPKEKKEKAPEVKATDKMKKIGEMETRVAEKKHDKEEVKDEPIKEYVGLSPDEVKAMEMLASLAASGAGAAILANYKSEIKDLVNKVKAAIKSKDKAV
jgi:hypothetical protein